MSIAARIPRRWSFDKHVCLDVCGFPPRCVRISCACARKAMPAQAYACAWQCLRKARRAKCHACTRH
eukprot:7758417-Lingulodinium_polyedra.AAC.1